MKTALAVALLLAAAAPAAARESGVRALHPWSRPAAAGTNGVGYLTLVNPGRADALVGVDSPLAQKVEMHATSMAGGVMRMTTEDRAPLPAVLHFASGATMKIDFAVGTGAQPAGPMAAMPGMR